MSSILYIIYENNTTTPASYYPEASPRADIGIEQISSIINETHPTIDADLAMVTLLEMAEVIKRELSSGSWVQIGDFVTFQTLINAESDSVIIYFDDDNLEVIGYVYKDFAEAIGDAATFELLRYGFPREPWIQSAIESKYGLIDHVIDNHGLTITGEDFVLDKADPEQGVWIKSPAGNNYRQNKYTYISTGTIIITAELSGELGPAGQNSVEHELSIRASYDNGETISTGIYTTKIRGINDVDNDHRHIFLTGTQIDNVVQVIISDAPDELEVILTAEYDEGILSMYNDINSKVDIHSDGGYEIQIKGGYTASIEVLNRNTLISNIGVYGSSISELALLDVTIPISSLQNGVYVDDNVGSEEFTYYTFYIPDDADGLSIEIYNMTGDVDLYLKYSGQPTNSDYDYKSSRTTSTDQIIVKDPIAGLCNIGSFGFSGASSYRIIAFNEAILLTSGVKISSSAREKNYTYFKIQIPPASSNITLTCDNFPTDCDMYAKYSLFPDKEEYDYGSYNSGIEAEEISIPSPPEGTLFIGVLGFASDSTFDIIATLT